jgi:hypothetical protein
MDSVDFLHIVTNSFLLVSTNLQVLLTTVKGIAQIKSHLSTAVKVFAMQKSLKSSFSAGTFNYAATHFSTPTIELFHSILSRHSSC